MKKLLPRAIASFAAFAALLAGCSTRTDVSLTGYTPGQYSHVWITTQEVRFNHSDTAGPDDGGWTKYSLKTPTTVDLVAQNGGNLGSIATALRIVAGTYSQVRLIPLDSSAALASSAQSAGALYNAEADYVDSSGNTHQLPLQFLSPDQGIGIATSLKVPVGNVNAALKSLSSASGGSSTTPTSSTTGGNSLGIGSTTSTAGSLSSTSSTASTTPDNFFVVSIDGTTDLVPFNYDPSTTGVLLSSHAAAYDLARSGGISGQLTLSNITTATSGLPAIQVNAETLSADGTRHVVVSSTSVQSDGSFLLYPLGADSNGVDYDVVIHGPGIATIIIKAVQVTLPSSTIRASTSTTSTSTTTGTSTSANNVVAIGALTPVAATSFSAQLATSPAAGLPAGAQLQFYQTIKLAGEVPYVIESSAIDPFNQVLFNPQALSTGMLYSGTWSASGGAVTVGSAEEPAEGSGNYLVAASAPSYSDGALSNIAAPAAGTTSPVQFTVPVPLLAANTVAGTLIAVITSTVTYDSGQLLVSHNGTLVATASLRPAFTGAGAIVRVTGLPAGTSSALYYLSVLAWNQSSPTAVHSQSYPTAIDLQGSSSGLIQLTVN